MIFWRVFMRISYACPAHLKFGLTVERWSSLVQLTSESIDWLDTHERMYDVWLLVPYAATSCALVQVRVHCDSLDSRINYVYVCSIILGRGGKIVRRLLSLESFEIVFGDGRVRFLLTICLPDER